MAIALNAAFKKAAEFLKSKGAIGPDKKYTWQDTRQLAWLVIRDNVLPEFGIKPDSTAPEDIENRKNAFEAFKKAFDDGYTLESSNLGKHLAEYGYAPKNGKDAVKDEFA